MNKENPESRYVRLYDALVHDLGVYASAVFGIIEDLSKEMGYSYQSDYEISKMLGIAPQTVTKAISTLRKNGLLLNVTKENLHKYIKYCLYGDDQFASDNYYSRRSKIRLLAPDMKRLEEFSDEYIDKILGIQRNKNSEQLPEQES